MEPSQEKDDTIRSKLFVLCRKPSTFLNPDLDRVSDTQGDWIRDTE